MRVSDSRPTLARTMLAGTVLVTLALTGCSGSGDNSDSTSPTPSSSAAPSSPSVATLNGYPYKITGVTKKGFAKLNKVVPLLPGVQNTTYDGDGKTLRVFMKKSATATERAVVSSQLKNFTKRTPVVESSAPPLTVGASPTSS